MTKCCRRSISSNRRTGRSRATLVVRRAASSACSAIDVPKPTADSVSTRSRRWSSAKLSAGARRSRDLRGADRTSRSRRSCASAPTQQKQHYLPRLLTGEIIGAYALSESGSGSDALGARAPAPRASADGSFVLNGEKMWITNGGFADVFIVFAKWSSERQRVHRRSSSSAAFLA